MNNNFELKNIGLKEVYVDVFDTTSIIKWSKIKEPVKDLAYFEFRFRVPTSNDEHNSLYDKFGVLKVKHQVDLMYSLFLADLYEGRI